FALVGNSDDGVAAGGNVFAIHIKVRIRHEGRGVIGTGAPDFVVGYESTVNLAAFCAWAGVIDTNGLAICELALCLCRRAGPAGLLFLRKCSNCNQNEHRKTYSNDSLLPSFSCQVSKLI